MGPLPLRVGRGHLDVDVQLQESPWVRDQSMERDFEHAVPLPEVLFLRPSPAEL